MSQISDMELGGQSQQSNLYSGVSQSIYRIMFSHLVESFMEVIMIGFFIQELLRHLQAVIFSEESDSLVCPLGAL